MDRCVGSNVRIVVTGETEFLGENVYSVELEWNDRYGAIVEWYCQGKLK